MELTLKLIKETKESTISKLYVDGVEECYILEDVVRGLKEKKIFGKTAIPAGRYRVIVTLSDRFNIMLPLLVDVPGYGGVRIHPGNTAADTEGCLLPGTICATSDFVANSKNEFEELFTKIKAAIKLGKHVYINIVR